MYSTDKDALLCDLAETYHIYDFDAFKPSKMAIFAYGLREDSRIKMKIGGMNDISRLGIMIHAADTLTLIYHALTATKKTKAPKLFYDVVYEKEPEKKTESYASGEAFLKAWNKARR